MIEWHNWRAANGLFEFSLDDNYLSDYVWLFLLIMADAVSTPNPYLSFRLLFLFYYIHGRRWMTYYYNKSQDEWSTELIGLIPPPPSDDPVDLLELTNDTTDRQSLPSSVQSIVFYYNSTLIIIVGFNYKQLDLRSSGCVPPIKTQSPCGGCWAFTAATAIEYWTCVRNRNMSSIILRFPCLHFDTLISTLLSISFLFFLMLIKT